MSTQQFAVLTDVYYRNLDDAVVAPRLYPVLPERELVETSHVLWSGGRWLVAELRSYCARCSRSPVWRALWLPPPIANRPGSS